MIRSKKNFEAALNQTKHNDNVLTKESIMMPVVFAHSSLTFDAVTAESSRIILPVADNSLILSLPTGDFSTEIEYMLGSPLTYDVLI